MAESTATELLDATTAGTRPVDCHSTFAAPLPKRVTCAHLGIPPGEVAALLGICAAHCDTQVFPDPLKFDVTRNPNRHIAFGYGFTRCVGATIAWLNVEAAIVALAERFITLPFASPRPTRTGALRCGEAASASILSNR